METWNPSSENNWRDGAKCKGMDTMLFFPKKYETDVQKVLGVCDGCGIRETCLEYALENYLPGIWGGTTTNDRRKIRNGRKAERKRTEADQRLSEVRALGNGEWSGPVLRSGGRNSDSGRWGSTRED